MKDWQLKQRQNLPLFAKIKLTELRIRQWYEYWERQVYVSFSGGKDSTVLLHLVRRLYPNVPAMFIDSGLEYPEIRSFVKKFENVTWIRPKMRFQDVLAKHGWPVVSKRIAMYVRQSYKEEGRHNKRIRKLRLTGIRSNGKFSPMSMISKKWQWLLDAPFRTSERCCDEMKIKPARKYEKENGRVPYLGLMASESKNRELQYLKSGCNVFGAASPYSAPLMFWTDQDILQFVKDNKLDLSRVYGEISSNVDGKLKTNGCDRTGCMFCGFGVHLEKQPNRFQRMRLTHPAHWKYCIEKLGMGEILKALNVPFI